MNKARRNELKMLKFKKRLKKWGLKGNEPNSNFHAFRSHGAPCSCSLCSPYKYRKDDRHKQGKIDVNIDLIDEALTE